MPLIVTQAAPLAQSKTKIINNEYFTPDQALLRKTFLRDSIALEDLGYSDKDTKQAKEKQWHQTLDKKMQRRGFIFIYFSYGRVVSSERDESNAEKRKRSMEFR